MIPSKGDMSSVRKRNVTLPAYSKLLESTLGYNVSPIHFVVAAMEPQAQITLISSAIKKQRILRVFFLPVFIQFDKRKWALEILSEKKKRKLNRGLPGQGRVCFHSFSCEAAKGCVCEYALFPLHNHFIWAPHSFN